MGGIGSKPSKTDYLIKHLDTNKPNDMIMIENRRKLLNNNIELKKLFDQVLEIQRKPKTQPFIGLIGGTYSGQWKNNLREGVGEFMKHSQDQTEDISEYYLGNWKNDQKCGFGATFFSCNEYHFGEYKNGKPNGKGQFELQDGSTYDGDWVDGEQEGKGVETLKSDGWIYIGDFKQGMRQGKGKLVKNGTYELEGNFENNDFVFGTVKYLNQSYNVKEYKGQMRDGKFQGTGKLIFKNDAQYYDGEFIDHQKHGKALFCIDQQVKTGIWENDRFDLSV